MISDIMMDPDALRHLVDDHQCSWCQTLPLVFPSGLSVYSTSNIVSLHGDALFNLPPKSVLHDSYVRGGNIVFRGNQSNSLFLRNMHLGSSLPLLSMFENSTNTVSVDLGKDSLLSLIGMTSVEDAALSIRSDLMTIDGKVFAVGESVDIIADTIFSSGYNYSYIQAYYLPSRKISSGVSGSSGGAGGCDWATSNVDTSCSLFGQTIARLNTTNEFYASNNMQWSSGIGAVSAKSFFSRKWSEFCGMGGGRIHVQVSTLILDPSDFEPMRLSSDGASACSVHDSDENKYGGGGAAGVVILNVSEISRIGSSSQNTLAQLKLTARGGSGEKNRYDSQVGGPAGLFLSLLF
jgi:hypothetical protein